MLTCVCGGIWSFTMKCVVKISNVLQTVGVYLYSRVLYVNFTSFYVLYVSQAVPYEHALA